MKILQALLVTSLLALPAYCGQQPAAKKQLSGKQASEVVLKLVPGGKIVSKELEREEGKLVWSFDIKDGGKLREVWLDAATGALLQDKIESVVEEKAEAAKDKAEAKTGTEAQAKRPKPARAKTEDKTKPAAALSKHGTR